MAEKTIINPPNTSITGDPVVDKSINRDYSKYLGNVIEYENPLSDRPTGIGQEEPMFNRYILPDYVVDAMDEVDHPAQLGSLTPESLNELRYQHQSVGGDIARGGVRTVGKIVQEVAHLIGFTGGVIGQVGSEIGGAFGWTGKPKDTSLIFDNAFNNGVDNVFNSIFEKDGASLKTYVPKKVQDGSFWNNLGSTAFWATEGADAVGFFASMMAPGAAVSKIGAGAKILSSLGKIDGAANLISKFNKIKPLTNILGKIGPEGIDNVLGATLNTTFEAASEASGVYKDIKEGLIAKGENPEIANIIASSKAAETFKFNTAILIGPNLLTQNRLFGKKSNKLIDVAEEGIKKNPLSSNVFRTDLLKKVGSGVISEGFFEEGLQSATSEYLTKQGLNKEENKGFLSGIGNVIQTYADMWGRGDVNLQKSIFLGGMLGAIGGGVGAYRGYKQAQNTVYGNEGPSSKLGRFVSKLPGGDIFQKNDTPLDVMGKNLLHAMPEAYSGAIQKDENGKYKLNPEATDYLWNNNSLESFGEDKIKDISTGKILDDAETKGDKEGIQQYTNVSTFDMFKPYLKNEEGVEYLKKYFIPEQADILIKTMEKYKANMSEEQLNEMTPEYINKKKEELINKVDEYKKVYDDVNNRHDFETQIKYKLEHKQEHENFMNKIKNVKFQAKLDIKHSDNRISELEKRNGELYSQGKLVDISPSKLSNQDLVEYDGKKSIYLGEDTFGELDSNKTFKLKKDATIKKLDVLDAVKDEIFENLNAIDYNKVIAEKAKKDLNIIHKNKELQKLYDIVIDRNEKLKKELKLKATFKPNSFFKDKATGKRYQIDDAGDLYEETTNDKGEFVYVNKFNLPEEFTEPEAFKERFEEDKAPIKPEVVNETPLEVVDEPTNLIEDLDIELPEEISNTKNVKKLPTTKVIPEDVLSELPKGMDAELLAELNREKNEAKQNVPKDLKGRSVFTNEPITSETDTVDTTIVEPDTNPKESVLEFTFKRHILNLYNGTANNPYIGKTEDNSGNPNSNKANKVASDFDIFNGQYKFKTVKAALTFPNMRESFEREAGPDYKFDDLIMLILVDNDGNLIGLNKEWTELVKLSKEVKLEAYQENEKPFIYWALRQPLPYSKVTRDAMFYTPDVTSDRGMKEMEDLFGSDKTFMESDNKKIQVNGLTEKQTYALNLFQALLDNETKNHALVRENLDKLLFKGEPVNIEIVGHSKGIPTNKGEFRVVSDALKEIEGEDYNTFTTVKVATSSMVDFGGNNIVPSTPGLTYLFVNKNNKQRIYDVQPRQFNNNEVNNISNLFKSYVNTLNKQLDNGEKVDKDFFDKAEKLFITEKKGGETVEYKADLFGYLTDILHTDYLSFTQNKDSKSRKVSLRKNVEGNWANGSKSKEDFDIVIKKDGKFILNPTFEQTLNNFLPNAYWKVKSLKLNKADDFLNISSVDTDNGVVIAKETPYKEFLLENVLLTNAAAPKEIRVDKHSDFGGGTMTFTQPVFDNVYIKMNLSQFMNSIEDASKSVTEKNNVENISDEASQAKKQALEEDTNDEMFRYRIGSSSYTLEDLNQSKEWFKQRFPQFGDKGFNVVKGLLEQGIYGKVSDYAIWLDENAEIGTGYHEAFHMTTHYLLSNSERSSLYKEYRERNPKSKLSDKEIEEVLAEDFRDYVLSDGKIKYPPAIENIFRYLLRLIREFFVPSYKELLEPSINRTFEKIESGYYSKRTIKSNTEVSLRIKRTFDSSNPRQATPEFYQEVMEATNTYFFEEIRKSQGSFDVFFNKSNNKELITDTYKKVMKIYEERRKGFQDVVNELSSKESLSIPEQRKLNVNKQRVEDYDYILEQFNDATKFDKFRNQHSQELSAFGLSSLLVKTTENEDKDDSTEFNEENILDESGTPEEIRDVVWNLSDLSIKFDAKYNAQKSIKLLIGTLPKLYKNKEGKLERVSSPMLLTPKTVAFSSTFATILNKMNGVKGVEEIISRLNILKAEFPSIEYFYGKDGLMLNDVNEGNYNIPKNKFNELLQFVQTFSKTNNNFSLDLLTENGERDLLDSNLQAQRRTIKTKWKSNSSIINLNPKSNIFKNGVYNKDAFASTEILNSNVDTAYKFFEKIGIEFTYPEMIKTMGKNGFIIDRANQFLKAIRTGNQIDFFNTNQDTDFGGWLNSLIDLEYSSNIDLNVNSHLGIDGQSIYNSSLNSYISNILDTVNKFQGIAAWQKMVSVYPHLNTELSTNPYITNSIILKKGGLLFDKNGNRLSDTDIELITVEGISENEGDSKVEYNKLSKPDRLASVIDRLLSGQGNLIRPADKSLERFFKVGSKTNLLKSTNQLDYFIDYLKDDIATYRHELANKTNWKYIKSNTENAKGIYIQMLEKYGTSDSFLNVFNKFLKSNESIEEFFAIKKNLDMIEGAFAKYRKIKAQDLLQWMIDNEVVELQADGLIKSKGISLTNKISTVEDLVGRSGANGVPGKVGELEKLVVLDNVLNTEQLKVLFGNPNYFKKVDDFFKRTGSFPGTKKLAIDDFITSEYVKNNLKRTDFAEGLEDLEVQAKVYTVDSSKSKNKSIYKQIVFEDVPSYDEVFGKIGEETDGSSIISFDAYRDLLFRSGDWSFGENSLEDLYQYEMQNYYGPKINKPGFLNEVDYNKVFPKWNGKAVDPETGRVISRPDKKINMLKPLHVGPYAEKGFIPGISKTSFTVLYPSSTNGKPNLEKMLHFMRKNQISVTSFYSANKGITTKVNSNGKTNQLYVESKSNPGKYELNLDNLVFEGENANAITQNTYVENWGIQLDTGFKNKHGVIYGTQMMKQILSYLYSDGNIKQDFSDLKEIVDEYIKLNGERLNLGKQQLLKELDIVQNEEGNYIVKDYTKFKDRLKQLADARGMDDNTYESINFIDDTLGIDGLLNRQKFESAIFALNDSLVIKQKNNGGAFYQQPSTLHESSGLRTYDAENGSLKSSEDLKAYINKDGKIGSMEVMLPNMYKNIPIEKLNEILLNGIAFRIPTQGLASIEAIKVIGFLPESEGDTIVLPSAIVKKAGSDYDIDKLNVYLPYVYYNKKGEVQYISKNLTYEDYLKDFSGKKLSKLEFNKQQVENRITAIQREIILHPSNYNNLTKSLDDTKDIITNLVNEIHELRTGNKRDKGDILDIIDRINLTNVADRFLSSKQAVGITALASPFHILAQKSNLFISKYNEKGELNKISMPHHSDSEGNILLGKELDLNKGNIADILRQWISEAVDAAKDPRMFDLNVNLETLNVVLYLTMAGVPTKNIMYFVNQPIIYDYLNLKSVGKSKVKAVNKQFVNNRGKGYWRSETLADSEVRKIILNKYGNNAEPQDKDFTIENLSKYITLGKELNVNKSKEIKRKEGVSSNLHIEPFMKAQVRILNEYLKHKETANLLTNAVQGASWDTNSAGRSVPELLLRLYNTNKVLNKSSNVKVDDKLVNNGPIIGNYNVLLNDELSFINPYFKNNKDLVDQYSTLFKVLLGNPNVKTLVEFMIDRYDSELGMSVEDKTNILNGIVPGYLSYNAITKGLNREMYIDEETFNKAIDSSSNTIESQSLDIFSGDNSTPKFLDKIQEMIKDFNEFVVSNKDNTSIRNKYGRDYNKDGQLEFNQEFYDRRVRLYKKLKDNSLIQVLVPNVSSDPDYYDHIIMQYANRDNLEMNKLVEGWESLLGETDYIKTPGDVKNLALNMIKLLFKQEGVSPSPSNFIHTVPAKIYSDVVKKTFNNRYLADNAAITDDFIFFLQHHIQNIKSEDMAPLSVKAKNKSESYPFVRGKYEYKKGVDENNVKELKKQGKSVYKEIPTIYLRSDLNKVVNNLLPISYSNQTLGKKYSAYGDINPELFNLFNPLKNIIFAKSNVQENEEFIETEQNDNVEQTTTSFKNTIDNLKEAFGMKAYKKIFNSLNITSMEQIDSLSEKEMSELLKKICK
ncbi:MAG: hypothetical protein M0R17_04680 [Candidatus Omnitrophica bacterium]|jgi:hypothetical protein|nr:hypothetical protein [Candidatus Omnitrophota bacterium]